MMDSFTMPITLKVIATTDGKFVGHVVVYDGVSVTLNGFTFLPNQIIGLGSGNWRIHNSHYSADCVEIAE